MIADSPLIAGATNIVRLVGLGDARTNTYPTDAVVTGTLTDAAGGAIAGATNFAMPYLAGTVGTAVEYRAVLPASLPLVAGVYVIATVKAVSGAAERTYTRRILVAAG